MSATNKPFIAHLRRGHETRFRKEETWFAPVAHVTKDAFDPDELYYHQEVDGCYGEFYASTFPSCPIYRSLEDAPIWRIWQTILCCPGAESSRRSLLQPDARLTCHFRLEDDRYWSIASAISDTGKSISLVRGSGCPGAMVWLTHEVVRTDRHTFKLNLPGRPSVLELMFLRKFDPLEDLI